MTKRKAEVLNEITDYIHSSNGVGRLEIAKAVGLKKTPYLYTLLDEIVKAGWAREVWDTSLERPAFIYYPARPVVDEKLTAADYGVG